MSATVYRASSPKTVPANGAVISVTRLHAGESREECGWKTQVHDSSWVSPFRHAGTHQWHVWSRAPRRQPEQPKPRARQPPERETGSNGTRLARITGIEDRAESEASASKFRVGTGYPWHATCGLWRSIPLKAIKAMPLHRCAANDIVKAWIDIYGQGCLINCGGGLVLIILGQQRRHVSFFLATGLLRRAA